MEQAHTGGLAHSVTTLATPEAKVHPAVAWARVTTDGIVAIQPGTDPDRAQRGVILRKAVCQVLFETFQEVRSTSTFEDIGALTDQARRRIGECFDATPWAMNFREPHNEAAIAAFIHRNLLSAADLALKAE